MPACSSCKPKGIAKPIWQKKHNLAVFSGRLRSPSFQHHSLIPKGLGELAKAFSKPIFFTQVPSQQVRQSFLVEKAQSGRFFG
jgi:hypothetical protein